MFGAFGVWGSRVLLGDLVFGIPGGGRVVRVLEFGVSWFRRLLTEC